MSVSQAEMLQPFLLDGIRQVGSTIGDGSYASTVIPLRFRGLKCAGKRPLHTKHYGNASPQEKERMLQRLQEQCQLLSRLKHPNIVQFLGIYLDEGSSLGPVLVMEYLHCTLSESLKRYGVMQERVSLGILDDVVTGLCYLHEHRPPIVHGGLNANGVFLTSDMRAKISDVGVARIMNMTPAKISQLTNCPGKPPYMPPEALEEDPKYSSKTDCFSMGVMILHVLCGKWPIPLTSQVDQGKQLTLGSEVELRERYLQQVESNHPLLGLIRSCLDNDPPQRPTADQILCKIRKRNSELPPSSIESLEAVRAKKSEIGPEAISMRANASYGYVGHSAGHLRHKGRYSQEKESPSTSKEHLQIQNELSKALKRQKELELSHSIDVEQLQSRVSGLCTEVEGLRAVVKSKEKFVQAKETEKQQAIQTYEDTMKAMKAEKLEAIQSKEAEKKQAIQVKEMEKQQAIQAKEMEKKQAIQAMETKKQQAIKAMEAIIHAKELERQENNQKLKEIMQGMETEKCRVIQQKENEKQQAIQAKETEVKQTRETMEMEKQQTLKQMQAEMELAIKTMETEKQQAIKAMEALVQLKEKQIEAKILEMATKQVQIDSHQQEIALRSALVEEKDASIQKTKEHTRRLQNYILSNEPVLYTLTSLTRLHWSWKQLADMPVALKWPQSVLIHDTAFVASRCNSHNVLKYDTKSDEWSVLPPCPVMNFGLGQLSGKLIAVGGCAEIESLSGILGSCGISEIDHSIGNVYTYNEQNQQWEIVIPPMPTPRALSNVVSCGSVFATCGGIGSNRLVEIFKNKKKGKWFTGAPLPDACAYMQVAVVNDRCYLGGGGLFISNRSLMSASLPSLFQSHMLPYCQTSSESSSAQNKSVWTKLPDLPHYGSALASIGEVLLLLGGCKYPIADDIPSSLLYRDDILVYCPSTESWIKIGCLPEACSNLTVERLPSGELLLIGGTDSQGNDTMDVHVGTVGLYV